MGAADVVVIRALGEERGIAADGVAQFILLQHLNRSIVTAPHVHAAGHLGRESQVGQQRVAHAPVAQRHPLHGQQGLLVIVLLVLEEVFVFGQKLDTAVLADIACILLGQLQVGGIALPAFLPARTCQVNLGQHTLGRPSRGPPGGGRSGQMLGSIGQVVNNKLEDVLLAVQRKHGIVSQSLVILHYNHRSPNAQHIEVCAGTHQPSLGDGRLLGFLRHAAGSLGLHRFNHRIRHRNH